MMDSTVALTRQRLSWQLGLYARVRAVVMAILPEATQIITWMVKTADMGNYEVFGRIALNSTPGKELLWLLHQQALRTLRAGGAEGTVMSADGKEAWLRKGKYMPTTPSQLVEHVIEGRKEIVEEIEAEARLHFEKGTVPEDTYPV